MKFMNANVDDLIKIYITEYQRNGLGVMFITKNIDKVDVKYIPDGLLPDELKVIINEKRESSKSKSIMYVYVCDENEADIIEINLER